MKNFSTRDDRLLCVYREMSSGVILELSVRVLMALIFNSAFDVLFSGLTQSLMNDNSVFRFLALMLEYLSSPRLLIFIRCCANLVREFRFVRTVFVDHDFELSLSVIKSFISVMNSFLSIGCCTLDDK